MNDIEQRYRKLTMWSSTPTNRNYKDAIRLSLKARSFPFEVSYHGKTPDKDEYIVVYDVKGKGARNITNRCFLLERGDDGNPKITFFMNIVVDDEAFNGRYTVTINHHAVDRYCQRLLHKPEGYVATLEDLDNFLLSFKINGFESPKYTDEVVFNMEGGLMLGQIYADERKIILKTFVATSNLHSDQSLLKRHLKELEEK